MDKSEKLSNDIQRIEVPNGYVEIIPPNKKNRDERIKLFHKEVANILVRDRLKNE
ncbi:hypothetical protein HNQ94_000199 [Salirhabdus euzebyi]|uniref:Uncharacterized protein n=1 Tax=Salirhabdus euzebyi TaxID=394506 RepID=A0A841Q2X0_9BACI|nr:hypothetical protein [Salirhabdus euzebyi]MBB6451778.1 hypothetical protein [Salirhabdus euzebyi]